MTTTISNTPLTSTMENIHEQMQDETQAKSTLWLFAWVIAGMLLVVLGFWADARKTSAVPASEIAAIDNTCVRWAIERHFLISRQEPITRGLLERYESSCVVEDKEARKLVKSQADADAQRHVIKAFSTKP